jgi:hypothetical protein
MERRGTNQAVVALVHKTARIASVLLAIDPISTSEPTAA